jgi:hypothetical protein
VDINRSLATPDLFFGQKIIIAKQLSSSLRTIELYHVNDGQKRDKIVAELRVGRWSRFVETRIDTFASKTLGIVHIRSFIEQ